jgi:hypothetical protein
MPMMQAPLGRGVYPGLPMAHPGLGNLPPGLPMFPGVPFGLPYPLPHMDLKPFWQGSLRMSTKILRLGLRKVKGDPPLRLP